MKSLKLIVSWYHGLAFGSLESNQSTRNGNSTGRSMSQRIQLFADKSYGIVSKESPYGSSVTADNFNMTKSFTEIGFTVGFGQAVPINNPTKVVDGWGVPAVYGGGGYDSNSVASGNGWVDWKIQRQKDIEIPRIKASIDTAYNNAKLAPSIYNEMVQESPTVSISVDKLNLTPEDKRSLDELGISELTFQTSTLVSFARATEAQALETFAGESVVDDGGHTLTEDGHRLTTKYDTSHPGPYTTSFEINFPLDPDELKPDSAGMVMVPEVSDCEAKALAQMTEVNKLLADAAELHDYGVKPDVSEIEEAMEQDETECLEGEKRDNYISWRDAIAAAIADIKSREPDPSKYNDYLEGGGELSFDDWLKEQSPNFGSSADKKSGTEWWKNFWGATKAVSSEVASTVKEWGPLDLAKSYAIVKGTNAITKSKVLTFISVAAVLLFLLQNNKAAT